MSLSSLQEVFKAFNDLKILIIGDVMVDSYVWGVVNRISPEAPVPVLKVTKKENRLGGAANVALNVQALGATPVLCAVIGEDLEGEQFQKRLDVKNISNEGIVATRNRTTTTKTRVISGHQHIVRIDSENEDDISKEVQNQLLERIEKLIQDVDAVVFEDYDKGLLNKDLIQQVIQMAIGKGIPTVVDPKRKNFFHYSGVSLFKPNLKELLEGMNISLTNKDIPEITSAARQLHQKLNGSDILLTLSEKGVLYLDGKDTHHFQAHVREIADVSGAGDTVVSIATACSALRLSPAVTAQLANLGGGLVCEHMGVVPVEKDVLLKEAIENQLDLHL